MLKNALKTLKDNNIVIENPFTEVLLGDKTEEKGNVLYVKSIPDGLLYLQNKSLGKTKENHSFKHVSTMIDLSRNAVMNYYYFKKTIIKHALLGYDEVWLYMEDVFEVKEHPMFGYMRGRYSQEELKKMVAFANELGITLIPCVQTLGHMAQFLRWFSNGRFRDTFDILKVDSEHTYKFIEDMIVALKEAFNTTKIHIGMDEAFGLGFGRYYKENGYKPQPELFIEHLNKVNDICLKHGFEDVYIWSDMFFRMASVKEAYYDPTITFDDSFINRIPENVGLVYWDYYNENPDTINKMIEAHLKLNRKVIFASGTWIWTKLTYDKDKTDRTALKHIESSKKYNFDEICFTQWQDDGAYCDYESLDIGLFDMANAINNNSLDKKLFNLITNKDYKKEEVCSKINDYRLTPINLLWDDIIYGMYLNDLIGFDPKAFEPAIKHYEDYINLLKENKIDYLIYDIAKLILHKLRLRKTLLHNYQNNKPLHELYPILDKIKYRLDIVIKRFKTNWLNRYKINGLEVIESRLYVFYGRLEDFKLLIDLYDSKQIDKLDFLEQKVVNEPYMSPKFTDTFYSSKVF